MAYLEGSGSGSVGQAWPVGSVFVAVVATNPATLLGYGTWSAFAPGRVLVGIDSGDTDFDVVKETRGAKTVAAAGSNANESAHTHAVDQSDFVAGDFTPGLSTAYVGGGEVTTPSGAGSAHTHAFTGSATSVVQPSIVVYMWERTA